LFNKRQFKGFLTSNGISVIPIFKFKQSNICNKIIISLDAELIVQGTLFHKGRLKIIVSKLYITTSQTNAEPQPINNSHLVEVTCIVPAGQVTRKSFFFNTFKLKIKYIKDTIATEIKQFADLLKPYVKMDKLHSIMEEIQVLNPHATL
jgi:hypothetical protein